MMGTINDAVFADLRDGVPLIHEDTNGVLPAGRIGARGEAGEPAASEETPSILSYDPATDDVPQWHTAEELGLGGGGATALADLTDVSIPAPADGEVLTYDEGSASWVAAPSAGGSGDATSIQGEPVDATAPSTGEVLIYDGDSYAPGKLRASEMATVLTPIFTEDGHVVFDPDLGLIYVEVELV